MTERSAEPSTLAERPALAEPSTLAERPAPAEPSTLAEQSTLAERSGRDHRLGRTRRRGAAKAVLGTAAAVVTVGAAVAAALGFGGTGDTPAGSNLPPATAQVTRQTLYDTESVDGDLGFGPTAALVGGLRGTITALPVSGTTIGRGKTLYEVDEQPVVLMYGTVPAYRPLGPGDSGSDVRQLESNLKALGYSGFTVDDEYTSATADAVRDWQDKLGLPETGRVEQGRVVFASGGVRVDSVSADLGQPAAPGQRVLTYTGTTRLVTVRLDVADQRLAKKGVKVQVELPDGKRVPGKVEQVSTVIEPGSGQEAEPETQIEAIVSLADQGAAKGLDVAAVKVVFTAQERENVLTVPVSALLALAEGGYGVEVVDGGASRYLPVRTGLFADGRVEITGTGLAEGMTVGVPR